jgi:hypothetical protein
MSSSDYNHFIQLQTQNEQKLNEFIEFLRLAVCKRCWNHHHQNYCRPCHTHGGLLESFDTLRLSKDMIDKWSMETEHGFFHGFMVLFFAFFLTTERDKLIDSVFQYNGYREELPRVKHGDQLIFSCLLHDILKVENGHEGHDYNLHTLSNLFDPVTYIHAYPVGHESHPLVGGDRLELMRYSNFLSWCDMKVLEPYIQQYGSLAEIQHLFNHIRPALEKIFQWRHDILASHVLEINWQPMVPIADNKDCNHFPKSHWFASDEGYAHHNTNTTHKFVSINVGKYGSTCLRHTPATNKPRGIISIERLRELGNDIRCAPPSTCGRDHPFLVENHHLPITEWLFTYTDTDSIRKMDLKGLHIIREDILDAVYEVSEELLVKLLTLSIIRSA